MYLCLPIDHFQDGTTYICYGYNVGMCDDTAVFSDCLMTIVTFRTLTTTWMNRENGTLGHQGGSNGKYSDLYTHPGVVVA